MNFKQRLQFEYKYQFEQFLRFDKGCSRSIALRSCREVAPGTIAYRLPLRRKIKAFFKALKKWWKS